MYIRLSENLNFNSKDTTIYCVSNDRSVISIELNKNKFRLFGQSDEKSNFAICTYLITDMFLISN